MNAPENNGQDAPRAIINQEPVPTGEKVSALHQEEEDLKHNLVTSKKNVHNVALAEATALQKPSLLTKNMFKVSAAPFILQLRMLMHLALPLSIHRNIQFLHQRLRWFPHGSNQQLPAIPRIF
jgi:hypothetical protein